MLEAQILRNDGDEFTTFPFPSQEELAELIRPYLTTFEAKSLGLDPANDEDDHKPTFRLSILAGLGASASTAILFAVVGFLATLGLPDAAGSIAPLASSLI